MYNIYQFRYEEEVPTHNILGNECSVVSLSINATPGTSFEINGDENAIIISNTGNYSLNCEQFPITSLKIKDVIYQPAGVEDILTYPIIIDIVYKGNLRR